MMFLLTSLLFVPVWNRVVLVDCLIQFLLISFQANVSAASQRYSQGHKKVPNPKLQSHISLIMMIYV